MSEGSRGKKLLLHTEREEYAMRLHICLDRVVDMLTLNTWNVAWINELGLTTTHPNGANVKPLMGRPMR